MNGTKPLIINTNLKFAEQRYFPKLLSQEENLQIDYRYLHGQSLENLQNVTIVNPTHELAAWEKFVSSSAWWNWLRTCSLYRPIILLCTPVDIIEGQKHNSFLEALMADVLIYRARLDLPLSKTN
jgi:hypothetical protein